MWDSRFPFPGVVVMKEQGIFCKVSFNIPMSFYDGAEICELVGIFILNKLRNIIDKNSIGLYRDDGLGVFDKLSGPQIEKEKKKIIKIFKDCGPSVTVITNITSIDFLDLTLNLKTKSDQTFRKPNNDPIYIDIIRIIHLKY